MREHILPRDPAPALPPVGLGTLWVAVKPAQLRPEFAERQVPGIRKVDFRPDLSVVMLFPPWRFREAAPIILQLIGAWEMDCMTILNLLATLIGSDPLDLRVYRLDCTVDVIGHTIHEWRSSISVARKRRSSEHQGFDSSNFQNGRFETLTFGSRDRDQIRFYDKVSVLI